MSEQGNGNRKDRISTGGDRIPWGERKDVRLGESRTWIGHADNAVINHKFLGNHFTFDPQRAVEAGFGKKRRLRVFELSNGLRYAQVEDNDTGELVFDKYKLTGETDYIGSRLVAKGEPVGFVDLGDDFTLKDIDLDPASEHKPARAMSDIVKSVGSGERRHDFSYSINPIRRIFHGAYTVEDINKKGDFFTIEMENQKKGYMLNGLNCTLTVGSLYGSIRISLYFSPEGELNEIFVANGKIEVVNGRPDEIKTSLLREQYQTLNYDKIQQNYKLTAALAIRLLGVRYQGALAIDTQQTLDNLIENINSSQPKEPLDVIAFKNAARIPNWQPSPLPA